MNPQRVLELCRGPLGVVHLGLANIADGPRAAGVLTDVDFTPPAGGEAASIARLGALCAPPLGRAIDEANAAAVARICASQPQLVGVGVARDVIPGMAEDLFLHAGPPITWDRMSGPLRGAVIGGLLLEGRARDPDEAAALAARGAVRFAPCHHHATVGPMAGLVTPSMPVWILEERGPTGPGHDGAGGAGRRRTFATLNEGLGKVLRYGAFSDEVLTRLRYLGAELGPLLGAALARRGPIDLKLLMAQALQMGDEGHNRNRAATSLLFRELAPALVESGPADAVRRALEFIHRNDHFFLNLSMPMAKCMLMAAEGVAQSTILTVMARNGTDFAIQVASLPGRWFTGPCQAVEGLYFPGFSATDANPDIGDSAITETVGLGGFSMAAAPAIVQFVGGSAEDALRTTREMGRITAGRNPTFAIPALGFAGAPTGIDVRRVLELNLLPVINTGIAHRDPGVGQVGAGLTHPPVECFHAALAALHAHLVTPAT